MAEVCENEILLAKGKIPDVIISVQISGRCVTHGRLSERLDELRTAPERGRKRWKSEGNVKILRHGRHPADGHVPLTQDVRDARLAGRRRYQMR